MCDPRVNHKSSTYIGMDMPVGAHLGTPVKGHQSWVQYPYIERPRDKVWHRQWHRLSASAIGGANAA